MKIYTTSLKLPPQIDAKSTQMAPRGILEATPDAKIIFCAHFWRHLVDLGSKLGAIWVPARGQVDHKIEPFGTKCAPNHKKGIRGLSEKAVCKFNGNASGNLMHWQATNIDFMLVFPIESCFGSFLDKLENRTENGCQNGSDNPSKTGILALDGHQKPENGDWHR